MFNRIEDKQPAAWFKKSGAPKTEFPFTVPSLHEVFSAAEKFVIDHPGAALTTAFLTGATLAWWLKRK